MDVAVWLDGLGLGEHADAFRDGKIDAAALTLLTSEDLRELGIVALGDRKKLLAAIENLRALKPSISPPQVRQEATAPATAEGERRQVTVLFADLSSFTKLSTELGAEETHALLNRYFEAVDGIVEGYGGSVDKHIGDNVMAVFGAPVAHTDDPHRAVRAALDIHRAMAGIGEPLDRSLQVHIGVASGQVVASGTGSDAHREYTVTGESVILASRLQDLAPPGNTYISDAVQRAVGELMTGEAIDEVEIKGLKRPVRVWRVQGLRQKAMESGGRPFVGRRSELAQFAGVLTACRQTGSGQAVYIRGEAGIGKTRLVEEFQRAAEQQGFACHSGLVLDFGVGKGQDAIRTLVRSLLNIPLGSGKELRGAAAEQAFSDKLLPPERRVFLNDLLDLKQPTDLRALYDAMDNATRNRGKQATVAELVQRTSAAHPLLVTIEDVHWADPVVLAHLAGLSSTVTKSPAVLIMTSRVVGEPIDRTWRAAADGSPLMTIDLAPLRETEALELATEFLDASRHFALTCVARAEGNPLFLEQLLRGAEETGEEDVPGSIQGLVQARLDRLDAADRTALQAASVIGQRFALDTLRHLIQSPQFDCAALIEHLLVRPQGEDYLFAHALVRDAVHASLLTARRRELHRRAADWFAVRDPVLRAEHLDRAEDAAAAAAYLEAARAQAALYHHLRARQLTERGLEIAKDRAAQFALTCFHGDILRELGESDRSIEAFERAREVADDDLSRCRAWIGAAEGMRIVDRYDDALAALDRAEAVAHHRADELARIHFLRGNLYFPLGQIDGCLEQHELARTYAQQTGSMEHEARALGGLGDAYYQRGHMMTAHGHFRRCVELSREHGFGRIEVANLAMVGFTRRYLNELREALDDALATIEAAAKVGHQRAELLGRALASAVSVELMEIAAAREHLKEAQSLVERLGARRFEARNLLEEAKLRHLEGHRSEAVELCERAIVISRETGIGFVGPAALGERALFATDPAVRRQALQEGESLLSRGAVSHNHFQFYRAAMEACLNSRQWDEVDRYAAALEDFTRREPLPWCGFFIARGRTLAAHGRGMRDEATMQELRRLRDEGERNGMKVAMSALESALASAP